MLYSSSDRSLCRREEAGQGDRSGQVEGGGQQHHRERRTKDQREQAPLQEEQVPGLSFDPSFASSVPILVETLILCSGVCAMCGKQVLDTKLYKQSNV
ncbi:hypothetical protein MUK42_13524 [Musa troglodytarum]|uniref:Uncharacterized protein n=1 Tax=Musa troglodytarum TaxID=320322 RepID=A0A9E7I9R1_9LILI|nr:hypothetical protein MUK42_13524 [Musa troglodytarum]